MTDLERLRLLEKLLAENPLATRADLGHLAAQVESIVDSLSSPSAPLHQAFSRLWQALEVTAEAHQVTSTQPTLTELTDIARYVQQMRRAVGAEISMVLPQGGTHADAGEA